MGHFMKIIGRNWTTAALLALIIAAPLVVGCSVQPEEPPNILFIFTDDHAFQSISAYGSKINETPNIDRLASEGMLFNRCNVTNSICAPARAVIQTGKYSHINGVLDNRLVFDGEQQTFPKIMQANGYQTAIVGKWHLKSEPVGFDYHEVLPGQGLYYNPVMKKMWETVNHIGYTTEIVTDLAMDWLQNQRDQTKPFMLMLQHKAPHRRWEPGPDYLTMYDDQEIWEPPTLFDDYSGRGTAAKIQDMSIEKTMTPNDLKFMPPKNLTEEQLVKWNAAYDPKNEAFEKANLQGKELIRWKYQRYIKDYLRCIAAVDDNVGRVLDYLDESGLADNTVVVYTSDQGFYLGEHGWFDKRFMYKESYGTPLIVRWPGKTKPGSVNNDLVSNIDFPETFLDIAGLQVPADMQGASLKPILLGNTPDDWRKTHYYHYYEYPAVHSVQRHEGVFDGRYKLISFYDLNEWELFDLETDPNEMQSVYDDPAYASHVTRLKSELTRLRAEYKLPPNEPLKERKKN
jgi:arylsulfatase A-like enzyme